MLTNRVVGGTDHPRQEGNVNLLANPFIGIAVFAIFFRDTSSGTLVNRELLIRRDSNTRSREQKIDIEVCLVGDCRSRFDAPVYSHDQGQYCRNYFKLHCVDSRMRSKINCSANFEMEITCFLFPAMWAGYPFALFLLRCIMFRVSDRVVYIIYNIVVWFGGAFT